MRIRGLVLLLTACATATPAPREPSPQAPSGPTEADLLAPKIAALEQHADALEAARDDAVWAFWITGTQPTADPWAGHEVLLEDAGLSEVRRARELHAGDAGTLDRVEELIVSERVGRSMREEESAVVNLEASLHFQFEGRDVAYRELGGALAGEKIAARRQSLWAASLPAVKQLDAALMKRDEAEARGLAASGHTRESFGALLRHTDLSAALAAADRFVATTDARWKARLAAAHVASRADLPAMTKASLALDAVFPKGRIAERGTAVLASLGFYGMPQLTLDLTDAARKQPLPLTLGGEGAALAEPRGPAPREERRGVRMSFKPRGGWRDQQALLAELGRALALRHAPHARRQVVETTAALFGSLAWNRAWLSEQGISELMVNAAAELGADALLLSLRKAAGGALGTPEALAHAYALDDDPARARLDIEPLYAGLDTLRANVAAFALAQQLGPKWWSSPKSAELLRAFWASGELPADEQPLMTALGASP